MVHSCREWWLLKVADIQQTSRVYNEIPRDYFDSDLIKFSLYCTTRDAKDTWNLDGLKKDLHVDIGTTVCKKLKVSEGRAYARPVCVKIFIYLSIDLKKITLKNFTEAYIIYQCFLVYCNLYLFYNSCKCRYCLAFVLMLTNTFNLPILCPTSQIFHKKLM